MHDIETIKQQLLAEKQHLLDELKAIGGSRDNDEVSPNETSEIEFADEIPDRMETLEENEATEENLKALLKQTELALSRIETGTYGVCEVCQAPIEEERLRANPAATTCIAHR